MTILTPKLQIISESDNWIVVTDRSVSRHTLFDLGSYGKVTVAIFPLKIKTGEVKGIVLISFSHSHVEHKYSPLPRCLIRDTMESKLPDIALDIAGCYFEVKPKWCNNSRAYETIFFDNCNSFGCQLYKERFDVRRLLRVWCKSIFEYTNTHLTVGRAQDTQKVDLDSLNISLREDSEHCLEFMSLEPSIVFGESISQLSEGYDKNVRSAFGIQCDD